MTSPTVSVLLPVRDGALTLDRALTSLWRQTTSDFEVVAVDDRSHDDTAERLAAHAAREPRLRIVPRRGAGLVAALETARGAAAAPYLARMDADDVAHPERLRLQVAALAADARLAAVGCRVAMFPRRALGPGWRRYEAWLNELITPEDHAREIFVESPLAHPSVLMRADAVAAVGGYRDAGWAEDYDLWLRLNEAGWMLAKVPRTLLGWRHHEHRHSIRSARYAPDAFLAARAHFLARHPRFARKRARMWGAGRTGRRLAAHLLREGVGVSAFYEVDAAKIGRSVGGAPVLSWRDLPPPDGEPLVVGVGAPGARALIRPHVRTAGYREGIDAFFAG